MYTFLRASMIVVLGVLALLGLLARFAVRASSEGVRPDPSDSQTPKRIAAIEVTGKLTRVFDHIRDRQEPGNFPDAQITAWKEKDGTVNLMIPNAEAYRMRGPSLDRLRMDSRKIFSSASSAHEIPENLHNYAHWFMGPYSLDGRRFYTLSHSEWYACLLDGDCERTAADGQPAETNSWANTLSSFESSDGGKTWRLNVVRGNHVVADTAYHWTGSEPLARRVYLRSINHSGMFQPSRIIKEGDHFYSIAYYVHRNFDRLEPSGGKVQAPVDRVGYVLMRTENFADPNDWQAWVGADRFEPVSRQSFKTFLPQRNGSSLDAAPPQLIYDLNAHCYILVNTLFGGSNAVYFSTTRSLANPSWSDAEPINGTENLVPGDRGDARGLNDSNYLSILDSTSEGFNFEFTHGNPQLFFVAYPEKLDHDESGRDIYKIPLSVKYR